MLTKLSINNFALVDNLSLDFKPGLITMTGETGAGKSIVVSALALALGERADKEQIRHGTTSLNVEAVFHLDDSLQKALKEQLPELTTPTLTIAREVGTDTTSKIKINNKQATLAQLKTITAIIAEIMGQHAGQQLMDEEKHLDFLDIFAEAMPLRDEVAQRYSTWMSLSTELVSLRRRKEQLKNERELLLFQKQELEQANLSVGEEETLNNERRVLDSARALMTSAETIAQILGGDQQSVVDMLKLSRKELEKMTVIDTSLQTQLTTLTELMYSAEEIRRSIESYGGSILDDPKRIEEINLRLDEIYKLKKKYGGTEQTALNALAKISEQLMSNPDVDQQITEREKETAKAKETYAEKAIKLSTLRQKAAKKLAQSVEKELTELAIPNSRFACELIQEEIADGITVDDRTLKANPFGLEQARFLFSANPGEPLKSLIKTASGGEISRVLLALKLATQNSQPLRRSLLVFDEVDTGIGGMTAAHVGAKLKQLSKQCQVLVITHLHQIARLADHHLIAEKAQEKAKRTTVKVRFLKPPEVKVELERMVALPD
jgi:DNA repair protein RecN (Recombination protein N)